MHQKTRVARGNSSNTRRNNVNTCGKSCQLKLNDMNYHVNCHKKFDTQIDYQIGVPNIIVFNYTVKRVFLFILNEMKFSIG